MRNYVTTYDPFFDLFFHSDESNKYNYIMDTDVLDKKDHYKMVVNMPNINKEDIKISLEDGYLTIEASVNNEDKENEEEYVFRERNYGSFSRSFYIGEDIQMKDITAKLHNGVLELNIQKPNKEEIKKNHYIDIQ